MDEEIKRWIAKRKTALVLGILQGKTSLAEASRAYDLTPSEIEGWVEDGRKGIENALKANQQDVREQYERQIKDLHRWFGVARRTVYYRPVKAGPKLQARLVAPVKAMIEENPSFGYRTVAHLLGMNKNTVQRIFQLKGWPSASGRASRHCPRGRRRPTSSGLSTWARRDGCGRRWRW